MDQERIARVAKATVKLREKLEAAHYESKLINFVTYVWPVVEPVAPFIRGWAIDAIADHLEAVTNGHIKRLLINVPPGFSKSLLTDVFWPAWEWGPRNMPSYRYVCAAYSNHLTERDNMRCRNIVMSERYQRLWGHRFGIDNAQFTKVKFANDKTGWKLATSVGGIGVGERGDRFIIDDANNTMMMESEAIRWNTNMWFTEVVPDRLNSPRDSAIVVIQQRLHEEDVSGVAIARELGYTHLMVPMRYDNTRHCVTYLPDTGAKFWEDPRGLDDEGNSLFISELGKLPTPRDDEAANELADRDGELAWPERFPDDVTDALEHAKDVYAWCNPAEAPVLMADLSFKPIGEIEVGDKIVGFEGHKKGNKSRLLPAQVISVSKSIQPIVRITLDSGKVIRCTPNHKWYTGRSGGSRPMYAQARLGRKLMRVCDPSLPELNAEDARDAGWLAGFYDADGSVSVQKRHGHRNKNSCLVTFHQGAGRNLPHCEKLERILTKFGMPFGMRERNNNHKTPGVTNHKVRSYYLLGNSLPLYQNFIHTIGAHKWRERMIEAAYGTKWVRSKERVMRIDPDGEEIVYGLETTTGNYVVWGLASSNSGQYQQRPSPRGGSILRDEWWKLWDQDELPRPEFILASLDSAYTEKEENDPSAMTYWGVFRDDIGNPKLILLWAWEARLPINELVQKVIDTCTRDRRDVDGPRFKVDKLLIEAKASGISVSQEIRRIVGFSGKFGIELINPTKQGDKVARAHSIVHLFSDGMVYAPDRKWADKVIEQASTFPKGSHDDLVDSTTMALRYLRDMGFVLRNEEVEFDVAERTAYRRKADPIYPI